jgi:hypothetical protein
MKSTAVDTRQLQTTGLREGDIRRPIPQVREADSLAQLLTFITGESREESYVYGYHTI